MVQIHSPRPLLIESATYSIGRGQRAPGTRPGGRWFVIHALDHFILLRFNNFMLLSLDDWFVFLAAKVANDSRIVNRTEVVDRKSSVGREFIQVAMLRSRTVSCWF